MQNQARKLLRRLDILRCLRRGPATRAEIVDQVESSLNRVGYQDPDSKAGQREFEDDLRALRELGVEIRFDRKARAYVLASYGDFSPVSLGEQELETLAFLEETFEQDAPNGDRVRALIATVRDWLPTSQADSVAMRRERLRLDLRRRDQDTIHPKVQSALDKARGRQLLRFRYRTPGQADGEPRTHTVQPWSVYFDPVRGHLYLDAYCLEVEGPHGRFQMNRWQPYRLGRILDDGIDVLPNRLPPQPPKRPRHQLEYLLAPEIARTGEISGHFDDMEVHETDAAGWVRVTATTADLFRALRLLLGYGPMCRVVGGEQARQEMTRLVQAMAENYGAQATDHEELA